MKSGFLIIDKAENKTSNQIDYSVKKIFKTKKVGHLGTLDPFASGILIVAVNYATKLFPLLEEDKKTYLATIVFNQGTDTLDRTGNLVDKKNVKIQKEELINVLNSFLGKSKQIPPKYSAVHVNGKRAYLLARENINFEIEPKDIFIYNIKLLNFDEDKSEILTTVSKGTYIRKLAYDIAVKLNTVSYLSNLRRIEVGNIKIDQAIKIDDLKEDDLLPVNYFFKDIKVIDINSTLLLKLVKNGNVISFNSREKYLFFKHNDEIIALYQKQDDIKYHLVCILNN